MTSLARKTRPSFGMSIVRMTTLSLLSSHAKMPGLPMLVEPVGERRYPELERVPTSISRYDELFS